MIDVLHVPEKKPSQSYLSEATALNKTNGHESKAPSRSDREFDSAWSCKMIVYICSKQPIELSESETGVRLGIPHID